MKTITVSLPDDYAADLEARVAKGEYDSVDEAVTCAVAEWLHMLEMATLDIGDDADLRAKLRASIEAHEQGRSVDGEEFMARMERKLEMASLEAVKSP